MRVTTKGPSSAPQHTLDDIIRLLHLRSTSGAICSKLDYPLIAFTGCGRQGKDEGAEPLVERGYKKHSFGRAIKERLGRMTDIDLLDLLAWMREEDDREDYDPTEPRPHLDEQRRVVGAWEFFKKHEVDPFTEDDRHKIPIVPLMEWVGMWEYDALLYRFMETCPAPAINTRLMRTREGQAWVAAGGVIVEVIRDGVPRSEFERILVEKMRASGLIAATVRNTGTIEELHAKTRTLFRLG